MNQLFEAFHRCGSLRLIDSHTVFSVIETLLTMLDSIQPYLN